MIVTIRMADRVNDVSHFLAIRRSFGLTHDETERKRETYLDDLNDLDGRICYLALDEAGRACGFVQLVWAGEVTGVAQIHDLRVKAGLQSKGVGRALVAYLEEAAIDLGFSQLNLWVELSNRRAQEFYLQHGFFVDLAAAKPSGFDDCLAMKKPLDR